MPQSAALATHARQRKCDAAARADRRGLLLARGSTGVRLERGQLVPLIVLVLVHIRKQVRRQVLGPPATRPQQVARADDESTAAVDPHADAEGYQLAIAKGATIMPTASTTMVTTIAVKAITSVVSLIADITLVVSAMVTVSDLVGRRRRLGLNAVPALI